MIRLIIVKYFRYQNMKRQVKVENIIKQDICKTKILLSSVKRYRGLTEIMLLINKIPKELTALFIEIQQKILYLLSYHWVSKINMNYLYWETKEIILKKVSFHKNNYRNKPNHFITCSYTIPPRPYHITWCNYIHKYKWCNYIHKL